MTHDSDELLFRRAAALLRQPAATDDHDMDRMRERSLAAARVRLAAAAGRADAASIVGRDRRSVMRTLRVAAAALIATGSVAGGIAWWQSDRRGEQVSGAVAHAARATVARQVEFVLSAPGARRVALVGGFNAWDRTATPMQRVSDDAWRVTVAVPPGRHLYAFVLDGTGWVTDPRAPLSPERWFGARNSVLVVDGDQGS